MSKELSYELLLEDSILEDHHEIEHVADVARWYLENQRDPIVGTQTRRCTFSRVGEKWEMTSSLPIEIHFPVDPSELAIDWHAVSDSQSQGNALWKYSIGFLPTLLETSGDHNLVNRVLDSLWSYTKTEDWAERSRWMTSLDHCLAVRLRALCTLYFQFLLDEEPASPSLFKLLLNDVLNMTNNEHDYFPINNHGAMAAISLIHSCGAFPKSLKKLTGATKLDPLSVGLSEFDRVLGTIFDEFGVASENSPEYQRYWVSLIKPVAELFQNFDSLSGLQDEDLDFVSLQQIIEKAENALLMFTDPSGTLIPIGDTHPRKHSLSSPENQTLITEPHGFAIYRSQGTVFTLNSGSVNYAHKHCDDSSITLSFGGENLLLDAGYFSHDWNDPSTIYTKSQTAHSGLFLTSLDNIHPGKLYWPGKERIEASLSEISQEPFHVVSNVSIDKKVTLRREVRVRNPQQIELFDSVNGDISEYGSVVRRFIIPLDAQLKFGRGLIEIRKKNVKLELFFDSISELESVSVTTAQESPNLKGWVSPELKSLEPAHCLELPVTNKAASLIRIRLSNSL